MGADGEVVSVTVTEPRFTPYETGLLLASRDRDNQPRGEHGIRLSEATDPAKRWHVPLPKRDFAKAALEKAQDAYEAEWGDRADLSSLVWQVEELVDDDEQGV